MLMQEFDRRFAAKDEKSLLFEILRRVGGLDCRVLLASSQDAAWVVWNDGSPGDGSGMELARA